ncbi:hypothetical protein EES37_19140 [Streptomyces sp. ADI91-18]|nr:hypothetical protein EES37_19140 [Streptomyces sp. ADI91-18]
MEVAEDYAAGVDGGQRPSYSLHQPQGLLGVLGDGLGVGVGVDQRVVAGQPLAEGLPLYVFLREELVFPHAEQALLAGNGRITAGERGDAGDARQPGQHLVLVAQPGDGVHSALVQARVGPRLLQYDRRIALRAPGEVDAARVGEVQDALHRVRQVRSAGGAAGRDGGSDAVGHRRPVGHGEPRPAYVRHQSAVWSGEGEDTLTGGVAAMAFDEAAVTEIEGALFPARVAEDVRSAPAREQGAEAVETSLQFRVVDGVDRAELAAGTARGVFGVLYLEDGQAAQELEGDAFAQAVGVERLQHGFGVRRARGHVDLPSLVRQDDARGAHHGPHLQVAAFPACRQGAGGGLELLLCTPASRGFVEERIGEGVGLVLVVHRRLLDAGTYTETDRRQAASGERRAASGERQQPDARRQTSDVSEKKGKEKKKERAVHDRRPGGHPPLGGRRATNQSFRAPLAPRNGARTAVAQRERSPAGVRAGRRDGPRRGAPVARGRRARRPSRIGRVPCRRRGIIGVPTGMDHWDRGRRVRRRRHGWGACARGTPRQPRQSLRHHPPSGRPSPSIRAAEGLGAVGRDRAESGPVRPHDRRADGCPKKSAERSAPEG